MTLVPATKDKMNVIDKVTEEIDLVLMRTDDSKLQQVVSFIVNELGHTL